jgi:phospholipid/cholesterol/gamma-HCH transport system ATP-binding protein
VIELKGVHKRFGRKVVLDGVDFTVAQGETVALLGPSGAGKSVLLKHIIGLINPDAGEVLVDGLSVPRLGRVELSALRQRVGYAFQMGALFDSMKVFENIHLGIGDEASYRDLEYSTGRVLECLRLVNLGAEVADMMPAELSGGMRKRAGLARALAVDPEILFLDEPTAGLDPIGAAAFDQLIRGLQQSLGLTVFMVTHDLDSLATICDRIAVLVDKRIKVGTMAEHLQDDHPWIREYFHGPRGRAARHATD